MWHITLVHFRSTNYTSSLPSPSVGESKMFLPLPTASCSPCATQDDQREDLPRTGFPRYSMRHVGLRRASSCPSTTATGIGLPIDLSHPLYVLEFLSYICIVRFFSPSGGSLAIKVAGRPAQGGLCSRKLSMCRLHIFTSPFCVPEVLVYFFLLGAAYTGGAIWVFLGVPVLPTTLLSFPPVSLLQWQ